MYILFIIIFYFIKIAKCIKNADPLDQSRNSARMRKVHTTFRVTTSRSEGKRPVERPTRGWVDNGSSDVRRLW